MLISGLKSARHGCQICQTHEFWSKATICSASYLSCALSQRQELFEYTSGRWLYNEPLRLSERKLVFNVGELKRTVAWCLHQPESGVKDFFKLGEGGFNRVFQVTMKDGSEVLARLPYHSTKPNRFALASEVATLDLARANGIPVPKVLHYSADADNPVGAEFMIMDKVSGRAIGDMWFDMSEDQRLKIISEIVQVEARISEIELPAYGSIYYERDLPVDMSRSVITPTSDSKGLCVGPYAGLRWWYKERGSIHIDRGPHYTPLEVLSCAAARESAWLKAFGRPRLPFERVYRECMNFQKSRPEDHIESLNNFLSIAPYLVPQEAKLQRPILRHPDLQPNNIFVSDNLDIVGIIDWQHCSVLPHFLAAGIPGYCQNYRDEESLRFVPPRLPDALDDMNDEERAEALGKYRRRHLHFLYLAFTKRLHPAHFEVLDRRTDIMIRKVFDHAGEPWEGNGIPLKADLMEITQIWPNLMCDNGYVGETMPMCPITFTKSDVRQTNKVLQQQDVTDTQLEQIQNAIGISTDGWMPNEKYDDAVERARLFKKQGLDNLDNEEERRLMSEHWPFDDFDEA